MLVDAVLIGRLAVPITLGLVSGVITVLVDTAFVAALGTEHLAALAIGSGITVPVFIGAFAGLSSATQILVARANRLGSRNREGPYVVLRTALTVGSLIGIAILLGLPLSAHAIAAVFGQDPELTRQAAGYLTGTSLAAPAAVIVSVAGGFRVGMSSARDYLRAELVIQATNVVLNYLLIFGHLGLPRLELQGAALGSAMSVWVGAIYWTRALTRDRVVARLRRIRSSLAVTKKLLSMAFPISGHMLSALLASGPALLAVVAMLGPVELAAAHILIRLTRLATLLAAGLGTAAVSHVAGAGNRQVQRQQAYSAVVMAVAVTLPLTVVLLVLSEQIGSIFAPSDDVLKETLGPLKIVALTLSLHSAGIVLERCQQGAGFEKQVLVYSILLQWGVLVVGSFSALMLVSASLFAIWVVWTIQRVLRALIYAVAWAK